MTRVRKEVLYVAFDVEAAGPRLGVHSLLSVGACALTRECLDFDEYQARGLLFYTELKPTVLEFDTGAMRVGCLHLCCLEEQRLIDARFDPTHVQFDPALVLRHMTHVCEEPRTAAARFCLWLERMREDRSVIPLTDTVYFDSGHINLWLHAYGTSPLGHGGRDLHSIYQGFVGRSNAWLGELPVPHNEQPHRADHDAVELAQKGRVLLFEKLGW